MKKSLYIALSLVAVLFSCEKEAVQPESSKDAPHKGYNLQIPVRMENTFQATKGDTDEFTLSFADDTKVDISSSNGAASWTIGDQIVLCESNGVHTKWLYGDVDVETSEVTVTLDDGYSRVNYAIYPASAATSNFTTPTVVYADSYSMDGVVNPETFSMAPMVAINSGQLNFYHVGAVLRLSLHYIPLGTRKIRVTFNGMTYVTGTYSVLNPGTASASTSVTSGSHNYVEYTKSTDFELDTTLNIPLPIGDYSSCTGLTIGYYDASASLSFSHAAEFSYMSLVRASGKKGVGYAATDLSLVHPITRAEMLRETANCYVVTGPGRYCIPLYYGNSIVGGVDNLSNAAPAKVNANDGVFVNTYDVAISSGNIKTDLENAGKTLNTSGARLIWSTASVTSNALVIVDPIIQIRNGVGYLFFDVPSDRFQEGSALIGILKNASTNEYIWSWHIWITDGNVLSTEEYTNNEGHRIDFLNRPLGGSGDNSIRGVYYQHGNPNPLPPIFNVAVYNSNGSNFTLGNGGSTACKLGYTLSRPHYGNSPGSTYHLENQSSNLQNFYNIWDATQTETGMDKVVVKTIYDPSPAGMCVPRKNAFTGFTVDGIKRSSSLTYCNVIGGYNNGWTFKKKNTDINGSFWSSTGYRYGSSVSSYNYYLYYLTTSLSSSSYIYGLYSYCEGNINNATNIDPNCSNLTRANYFSVRPALCE